MLPKCHNTNSFDFKKLLTLTNSIILKINICDTLRPLDTSLRPFTIVYMILNTMNCVELFPYDVIFLNSTMNALREAHNEHKMWFFVAPTICNSLLLNLILLLRCVADPYLVCKFCINITRSTLAL